MEKRLLSFLVLLFSFCGFSQNNQNTIDSLKSIANNAKTQVEKATILSQLVDAYFDINKDSAEVYIKKTLKLTKDQNNLKSTYIHGLLKYAQLYIVKGKYKTSASYYDQAWDILKKEYNYDLYSKYYGDLGVLHFYEGDFKAALESFNKALQLAENEKNDQDQLRFLNNKALAMSYLGQAEPSLVVHKKAIDLAEKLNDSTSLGKSFNNIGLIYEDMKAYDKALEFYLQALEIKKNGKSKIDVANSLFNVAGMYKEIGEKNNDTLLYVKAEKHYNLALEKAKQIDYGKVVLFSKTGMAQLATVRNKPLKAIKIYESVVEEAIQANDKQTLRVTYLNLGVNHLKIGNFNDAETYLLKAKPLIIEAENPSDMASLYKNLSVLYKKTGNHLEALKYFEQQYEIEKNLTSNSLKDKISEFEVKYETEKKEKEILLQRTDIAEKELHLNTKNTQLFGLGVLAIVIAILGYLVYKQQKLKNSQLQKESELKEALVKIETQNSLQEQRLRISRDLHDNIGAQLTFIISSIDNLKYGFQLPDKLNSKLKSISEFTTSTIYELRDTIWAMNKSEISLEDLQTRISNYIDQAHLSDSNIKFEFNVDDSVDKSKKLTSVEGINIHRIIQEAIHNSIKYANANTIEVDINKVASHLVFTISDDGIGFDENKVKLGNGIENIKKRALMIDGELNINSEKNKGTTITLNL